MRNTILKILVIVAFMLGFLLLLKNFPVEQNITNQTNTKWETKTIEQDSVTVSITPLDIYPQSQEWKFNVEINTHSGDLIAPTENTVLVDDQGKEYKPTSWNGPTDGHHMNGILTFAPIIPTPKIIKMKITGAGGVARDFIW